MKKFKKVLVKDKKWENTTDIAGFFGLLSEKLADKKLTFDQGSGETVIELPDKALFRVSAREKETRRGRSHSINFKIRWIDGQSEGALVLK